MPKYSAEAAPSARPTPGDGVGFVGRGGSARAAPRRWLLGILAELGAQVIAQALLLRRLVMRARVEVRAYPRKQAAFGRGGERVERVQIVHEPRPLLVQVVELCVATRNR